MEKINESDDSETAADLGESDLLSDLLCANTVKFGLEQQGHIPVIEEMLDNGCSWPEINRAIGWAGDAARDFYLRYLRRQNKKISEAVAAAKSTKGWDAMPYELNKRFDELFRIIGA